MKALTVESNWLARVAGALALLGGLGVLVAGCVGRDPVALWGLVTAIAGTLLIANDSLRSRIAVRTADLEQSNDQLRAEIAVRRATERALELSEKRLQDILATLPIAVIVKDAQSRIQMMNRATEDGWGVPFEHVAGTSGGAWMSHEALATILAEDQAVFAGREVVVRESQVWNKVRETMFEVESYKKPVFDADGKPHSLICVYVDITQRKHAEDALHRSFRELRDLAAELEMLKEEDRKRIAQGIHDDLGQNLLALKLDVQMLHARAGARHPLLKQRVGTALDTIDATIRSVRAIMNDLHPSTLELGLPVALEWLVDQFEKRSGICCSLRTVGEHAPLPDPRRTSVAFRLVQEALVHVLKHARARRVDVTLALGADELSITIADDGNGIGRGAEAAAGLRAIRERIDVFGGDLEIDSMEEGGTRLSISIPTDAGATEDA